MKKKILSGIMAAIMVLTMAVPVYAAENTERRTTTRYVVDLDAVDEKTWKSSATNIRLNVNGKLSILRANGETVTDKVYDEKDLGLPVLFRYDPNGKLDEDSMNITYVPIRKLAQILGLHIDWNDETKNVVLDTPKGRIEFPIYATSIKAPDGTMYEETTYRFPDGSPINITAVRNGRTYVTARFLSTFIMPNAMYQWIGTRELRITGTTEGTVIGKTYGINKNYVSDDGVGLNIEAMPTLVAALEGANYEFSCYDILEVYTEHSTYDEIYGKMTSKDTLKISGTVDSVRIFGFDWLGHETQFKVLEAFLTDTICDADRDSIMALLKDYCAHLADGYTSELTAEAAEWKENFPTKHTFTEVTLEFENLEDFRISDK